MRDKTASVIKNQLESDARKGAVTSIYSSGEELDAFDVSVYKY